MLLVHDFTTARAAFKEGVLSWFSWKKLNGLLGIGLTSTAQ